MRIRVLGAGWYGCSVALTLINSGHYVEIHEAADTIFAGASGHIPARLHLGFHYPRSRLTRAACLEHIDEFMERYGDLTSGVETNIYAIARHSSLVDYEQYVRTLTGEVQFVEIARPEEFGLQNVDGALLTGERHILTSRAKSFFEALLDDVIHLRTPAGLVDNPYWDWTIDATFCANDSAGVDRYEPCLVVLMKGDVDKAVTIMDGPFPSLYPWNPKQGLVSLSSALFTPFSKTCKTWAEAKTLLDGLSYTEVRERADAMVDSMGHFFPAIHERYSVADTMLSIRAMPLSGADTRLVDIARVGERALRIRAGKIDAVIAAERRIMEMIGS